MMHSSLRLSLCAGLLLIGHACSKDTAPSTGSAEPAEPAAASPAESPATEASHEAPPAEEAAPESPVETAPESAGTDTPPAPPQEATSNETAPTAGSESPAPVADRGHTIEFDPPTPVRPGVHAANSPFRNPMRPNAHSERTIQASAADAPRPAARPPVRSNVNRPPRPPAPSRPQRGFDLTVTPRVEDYFTAPAPPRIPPSGPRATGQALNAPRDTDRAERGPQAGSEPPAPPADATPPAAPTATSIALCEKAHGNVLRILTAAQAPPQVLNRLSSDKAGFLAQCQSQPENVVRCVGDAPDQAALQRCSDEQPNARPPNQALRPLCEQAYDNATRILLASEEVPENAAEQMRDRRDDAISECLRENETNVRCIIAATTLEQIQACNRPAEMAPNPALRPVCEAAFETFLRVAQPGPDMPQEVVDRLPSQKDEFINGCLLQPQSVPECMKAATTLQAFRACAAPPAPPTPPTRPTPAPAAPTPAPAAPTPSP